VQDNIKASPPQDFEIEDPGVLLAPQSGLFGYFPQLPQIISQIVGDLQDFRCDYPRQHTSERA
jgi:hypothetical protein